MKEKNLEQLRDLGFRVVVADSKESIREALDGMK